MGWTPRSAARFRRAGRLHPCRTQGTPRCRLAKPSVTRAAMTRAAGQTGATVASRLGTLPPGNVIQNSTAVPRDWHDIAGPGRQHHTGKSRMIGMTPQGKPQPRQNRQHRMRARQPKVPWRNRLEGTSLGIPSRRCGGDGLDFAHTRSKPTSRQVQNKTLTRTLPHPCQHGILDSGPGRGASRGKPGVLALCRRSGHHAWCVTSVYNFSIK